MPWQPRTGRPPGARGRLVQSLSIRRDNPRRRLCCVTMCRCAVMMTIFGTQLPSPTGELNDYYRQKQTLRPEHLTAPISPADTDNIRYVIDNASGVVIV